MSGGRPDSEAARRGGLVPFTGSSNGRNNNNSSSNVKNGSVNDNFNSYPNVSSNMGDNFAGNPAQDNVKTSSKGGANNGQLWSAGSGAQAPGSAPVWPDNQQGAPNGPATPGNPSANFDTRQTSGSGVGGGYIQAAPGNPSAHFNTRQTSGPGVGGGYIQGSQPGNGPGPQQQQQQQAPNWQGRNVQEGVPVNAANNWQNNQAGVNGSEQQQPNWQGPQGGFITQGPERGPMPKGDYVYYDGKGNQIQPGPPPGATGSGHWTGSGSERHFHHHYYYNQEQQPAPVGYPYDKKLEQKKKRRPGAKTLAAALIACWACTCCCHGPCGC